MRRLTIAALIILISLLVTFGILGGHYFATGGISTPFADTAIFIVTLVGVLVVLASIGIWATLRRLLHEDIAAEISRIEEATRCEALSRMAKELADSFWVFYQDTHNIAFRDQAIKIISDAREIIEGRGKVDVEELKGYIYNNLAFAYAEKGEAENTAMAHSLINYVMEMCKNFPKEEANWLETYAYVLYRLPKKSGDTEKALGIINDLLQRQDVSDKAKHIYRQRYSISDA